MVSTLTSLKNEKIIENRFVREEEERPTVGYSDFSDAIPVISLSGIDDDDNGCSRRCQTRKAIASACEDWGIFHLVDHGIDPLTLSQMASFSRHFFSLPDHDKLRYDMSGGKKGGFIVSSHLQGEAVQDWREIVTYFTYPKEARDYRRWPDKPEGWREVTEAYSEKVMELGCKLLELLSEAMGLEKKAMENACMELDQKVVVNYYPICPQPELTLGLKRHTDPGTLTLLLQDDVGGLQATRDGGDSWITVKPVKDAFVVNIGDHGHYLSNGRFKSGDHRAVVNAERSRLSIATFQNPAAEAVVYPLKVGEGEEAVLEKPITFKEMYVNKMEKDLEMARLKKLKRAQNK